MKCFTKDTGHETTTCQSLQTLHLSEPVVMLSLCLGLDTKITLLTINMFKTQIKFSAVVLANSEKSTSSHTLHIPLSLKHL